MRFILFCVIGFIWAVLATIIGAGIAWLRDRKRK
jgi:hypothetical protein